jgi:pyruvate dehydrogenase E2 component (dihydrolipoamide acetyltransferase)
MEAGTLVEWLVKPGDVVKRGDVVAVVETQKGAIEVEIYQAGRIEQILVGLDSKVPVGTPLARIRVEGEAPAAAEIKPPAAETIVPAPTAQPAPAPGRPEPIAAAPGPTGLRVSPAARRLAQSHGIDLSRVIGSGPEGAITYADVEQRIGTAVAAPEKKQGLRR